MTWLKKVGFSKNPFYLDPVPSENSAILLGFINRKKERQIICDYAQLKNGKLFLLGRRGEGKSSLLNLFENETKELGKLIFKVDVQKANSKEKFLETLLAEVERKMSSIPNAKQKKLSQKIDELNILKMKKGKELQGKAEVGSKIGALLASISGKISAEIAEKEEIEYFVPSRMSKLEDIFNDFLPVLFDSFQGVLICDNLERLPTKDAITFLDEVVQSIPTNILFITTGDPTNFGSKNLQKCYNLLDFPILMETIDTTSELQTFIEGRVASFSYVKPPVFSVSSEAIEVLLSHTDGNLRECFRYCFVALRNTKKNINKESICQAIVEVDKPKFSVLDDIDDALLEILSENEQVSVTEVSEALGEDNELNRQTIINRLDALVFSGLALKKLEKKGRTRILLYWLPELHRKYFFSK